MTPANLELAFNFRKVALSQLFRLSWTTEIVMNNSLSL